MLVLMCATDLTGCQRVRGMVMGVSRIVSPRSCLIATVAFLSVAGAASCSGGAGDVTGTGSPSGEVITVAITPSASSLQIGATLALQATAQDGSGHSVAAGNIFWSSSDTTVAAVSSAGVVTARAIGTASVAASMSGRSAVATITVVQVPVASVAVVPGAGTVSIGSSMALTAVAYDATGTSLTGRAVVWASSGPGIATVDGSGIVTGVTAGAAQITATSEGKSGTATVNVVLVPVASVAVAPGSLTLTVGQAAALTATATDANGNVLAGRGLTWSSSNTTVATVAASGLVTAVTAGTASVTATSEGHTATAQVVVSAPPPGPPPPPAPVASISLTPQSAAVAVGGAVVLQATLTDASGNVLAGRAITWTSSAPQVASVNQSGGVSAASPGTATITAASEGRTATAVITVNASAPPPPAAVAGVTVTPQTVTLVVGSKANLSAAALDAAGNVLAGRSITWLSGAQTVVTVSSTGAITAVGTGTTTITATCEGQSGSATVTVIPQPPSAVASVTVRPATATLTPGGTVLLGAILLDSAQNVLTGRSVAWLSSAPQVASVDSMSGAVTAYAPGSATITATSEGKSGTAQITVNAPPPVPVATVTVSPSTVAIVVGASTTLSALTRDASNNVLTGRTVSWVSSNTQIATVSASGVVTGVAQGTATITATSETQSGSATVTVTPVPVASVTVAPSTASVAVGGTVTLAATTRDAGGNTLTGRLVTWTSSSSSIATVSSSGVVTAVAAGSATITATSEGRTGTAQITVNAPPPAPVATVTVTPASDTLTAGGTTTLDATTRDASGNVLTGRAITWTSSATGVASVSTSGVVTAVAAGSATISATSEGHSGSASVLVIAAVDHLVITPTTITMARHDNANLSVAVYDASGNQLTGRVITWSSSDSTVVSVSATGASTAQLHSGNSTGTATVTATCEGHHADVAVTVRNG